MKEDESAGESYIVEAEYSDEQIEEIEDEIERQLIDRGVNTQRVDITDTLRRSDTWECHHYKNCLTICVPL
ncbi:hypothetical protein [Natrinema halophilum]|uniref:Uncharacterized protein n=1 Tax=Natrinema halophilum TaxID=1699371 RepID=A0A7D5KJQ3_9EURY|nr:hypothetical protein [Natrinema halophilum]QLG49639.1 hypothetical protein HYG82_12590 [Natrinema halophilum]